MIYLDNAATTRVSQAAAEAAVDAMRERFGNPSSLHGLGIEAEKITESAREVVAKCMGVGKAEVYFTGGGTEGNNLAILGAAQASSRRGRHIITGACEHASVLEPMKSLEAMGWEISYIKPDSSGHIRAEDVCAAVREDTTLVSVMSVNNEVGAVNPIADICRAVRAKNKNTLFHTDAVQAFFKLGGALGDTGADIITVSGHKINAPKGIGAIYVKKGVRLAPRNLGGGQERGMRSGTESVPLIAAFSAACSEWYANGKAWRENMAQVIGKMREELNVIDGVEVIAGADAPHILSVSPSRYPSEVVMRMLEQRGIYVSSGSACSKGKRSHVLSAMGVPVKVIDSTIRISAGRDTTCDDAQSIVAAISEISKRG